MATVKIDDFLNIFGFLSNVQVFEKEKYQSFWTFFFILAQYVALRGTDALARVALLAWWSDQSQGL